MRRTLVAACAFAALVTSVPGRSPHAVAEGGTFTVTSSASLQASAAIGAGYSRSLLPTANVLLVDDERFETVATDPDQRAAPPTRRVFHSRRYFACASSSG
jgi:hypothetical protein